MGTFDIHIVCMMRFFRKKKTLSATVILPRRNRPARSRKRLQQGDVSNVSIGWPLFYTFLWALFFGSLPAIAFFSPLLRVQELSFSSNDSAMDTSVRERTRELLAQSAIFSLPGNTLPMVWIRQKELVATLLREFPALRLANIDLSFPNSAKVDLEFRRAAFVLCSAGPCFFVDDRGVAYMSAAQHVEDVSIFHIIDQSGKPISLGDSVMSESFVAFVESAPLRLRDEVGVEVGLEATTPSRLSNEIRFQTTEGWELRTDADVPMEQILLELRTLFAKALTDSVRPTLVYVDLRAPGKVFYLDRSSEEVKSEDVETRSESAEKGKEKKKK